jgi:hypothetical protein
MDNYNPANDIEAVSIRKVCVMCKTHIPLNQRLCTACYNVRKLEDLRNHLDMNERDTARLMREGADLLAQFVQLRAIVRAEQGGN